MPALDLTFDEVATTTRSVRKRLDLTRPGRPHPRGARPRDSLHRRHPRGDDRLLHRHRLPPRSPPGPPHDGPLGHLVSGCVKDLDSSSRRLRQRLGLGGTARRVSFDDEFERGEAHG
jgi:hypothetical protein